MFKRTSTPAKKGVNKCKSIANVSTTLKMKKKSIGIQTDINTDKFIKDFLEQGKNMNDQEFEKFVQVHASDCYWKILAERARIHLEDQLEENRQLHHLLEQLTKENEQLHMKNEQCEYLTNIFNSIISEHDSGIELHTSNESTPPKRQKTDLS